MTREGNIKWAKEIDAQRQGKTIQLLLSGTWVDVSDPMFNADCEYRVKPEPRERYEVWFKGADTPVFRTDKLANAENYIAGHKNAYVIVKYVEVIE